MNGKEIVETLNQIFHPSGKVDDWVEIGDMGYAGCLTPELKKEIVTACGEYDYELEADRPFGQEDVQRTVLHFKEHNVYIALDGYYDSWSGGNWDCAEFYEVKPVEKNYTDWVKV